MAVSAKMIKYYNKNNSFYIIPHEYAPETQFTQAAVIQKMQYIYSYTLNHGVKSKVHPGVSHSAQNSLPHPPFSYDEGMLLSLCKQ